MSAGTANSNYGGILLCAYTKNSLAGHLSPTYAPLHFDKEKGQHTVDVEGNSGPFAHRHRRIAGHTGEVAAAVSVGWCERQVAPGRHPLSVW